MRQRKNYHIDSKTIGGQNLSSYKVIAEIIKKKINLSSSKVLDVGCYDGKLLTELSKGVKNCQFYGYDVGPGTKKLFTESF